VAIKLKKIVCVENEKIISVEPGNVNKGKGSETFVAFSVRGAGDAVPTKAILKGELATTIYNLFLAGGNTVNEEIDGPVKVVKDVRVSFIGFVKEERKNELVLHECADFNFNFNYTVID
jgi:hypothetical protein